MRKVKFDIVRDSGSVEIQKQGVLNTFVDSLGPNHELLRKIETFTAKSNLGPRETEFEINVWTLPHPNDAAPLALCMHGHGHTCCVASWARFWIPLHRAGFRVVAFDAPCFGQSSGPAGQANLFRSDDAELVIHIVTSFGCSVAFPCTVLAQCMGGAMLLRAMDRAPQLFSHNHVLSNCTIGTWPENITAILRAKGGGFYAYHELDSDHMREAVAYCRLSSLMLEGTLCTFIDNERARVAAAQLGVEPNVLDAVSILSPGLSRTSDGQCFMFEPNTTSFAAIMGHLTAPARKTNQMAAFVERKAQSQITAVERGCDKETAIKVFVRVRPHLETESGEVMCCKVTDIQVDGSPVSQIVVQEPQRGESKFVFSKVFEPANSQDTVYMDVARPLLLMALHKHINVTLLAYGQTGSGKTFTVFGEGDKVGVIPRLIHELYASLESTAHLPSATLVQLYNEKFYDLFNGLHPVKHSGALSNSLDAKTVQCATAAELMNLVNLGMALRAQGATGMNSNSSRSHAILSLTLATGAKITLVDLAGSERVKRSKVEGQRLQEAVSINTSLLALGSVVAALVATNGPSRAHIPYRDSPLTTLLSDSIGGTSRCAIIACVSPLAVSSSETISTLRFATQATFVNNAKQEETAPPVLSDEECKKLEAITLAPNPFTEEGINCPLTDAGSSESFVHVLGDFSAGPQAPIIMLLHYFGAGSAGGGFFKDWFQPLAAAGFRCLAPSFPGHGLSPGPPPLASSDSAKLAGLPCKIVKQVLDHFGIKKAVLLGFDWGGGIAFEFAIHHPARVAALVGWSISYREEEKLSSIVTKSKLAKSKIALLWAKDDPLHSFKKGQKIAGVLGIKITPLTGEANALPQVLKFMSTIRKNLD